MYGDNETFDTYKITFDSIDHAREFRYAITGFWEAIKEEEVHPTLKQSVQKLLHYIFRDETEPEFDFDGITIGSTDNPFIPRRRYGWALDIHDIAVAITCLSMETEDAQTLLLDMARGIRDAHVDPSTTLKTEAGQNFGLYIQITEELEDDEITKEHVHIALRRLYEGQGVTNFDRERYTHPSHDITDPKTFISSIAANEEVEGLGSTLPYIYEKFVELGEDETTANLQIILHELLRMSSLNLDRPMVLLGSSGIEEALLVMSGINPDNTQSNLGSAINRAYSKDLVSKELGYACSIVREVRNELGHTSWPSANIKPGEITLTSSLVILILSELLDTPIVEQGEFETLIDEFRTVYNWTIEYENGNFKVEIPQERNQTGQ